MRYTELQLLLGGDSDNLVRWTHDGALVQVAYNIVPVADGFTMYCPSDREGFFRLYDDPETPVLFASEDEVCDYIWAAVRESRRPKRPVPEQTPERMVDRRRRTNENRVLHGLEPLP